MNRNIIVTGGSFGMGRSISEAFLTEGDRVVFTARRAEKADEFLSEYEQYASAGKLFFFQGDIGRDEDVSALYAFARKKIGGCDVLVNNAAICLNGMVHETDMKDFDFQFGINFRGLFLACKTFLPGMLSKKSGCIINIASDAGRAGSYNLAVYAATKAAVINLSQSMAIDYAEYGIRVNCVCPSATASPMFLNGQTDDVMSLFVDNNPSRRIGKPSDIADAVVFLASEKADYIRGQTLSVDGGLSAWCGEARQHKDKA